MTKSIPLSILLGLWTVAGGIAQTNEELVNDAQSLDNVVTQSMGYDRKSYSPLTQINKSTISKIKC